MTYNNEMARQFNGPIIASMLTARHEIYDEAEQWLDHRQHLSIDNATEEELEQIGKFLSIPRPYSMVEGVVEQCSVEFYRLFLKNVMLLRTTRSILDFRQMLEQFMPDGLFFIEIKQDGDIKLTIDVQYKDYEPFFQIAADTIFNTLPRINPIEDWDFTVFLINHVFFVRLARLVDPTWYFSVENHVGVISCPAEKVSYTGHTINMTIA